MIAFTADCRSCSSPSSVSPSITGMLMSSSINSMSGSAASTVKRFLAVMGEAESELPVADLAAKALPDQQLEIGLVVDGEDFGRRQRIPFSRRRGNWRSCSFN